MMASKIFRSILLVTLIVLVSSVTLTVNEMYQSFFRSQMEQLEAQTRIIAYGIDEYGLSFLDDLEQSDYRITVINKQGDVIYDSITDDLSQMDNHLDRQEVIEAFEKGYGSSSRQSSTLTEKYVYTAKRLKSGDVVRLSGIHSSVFNAIYILLEPLLFAVLLIIIISLPVALHLTRNIVDPLNEIDVDKPDEQNTYKEIRPILDKLSQQQKQLNKDRDILLQKKEEFETITGNMNEGMILLNIDGVVIDINKAARDILKLDDDVLGAYISQYENYSKIADLIENASNNHRSSKHIHLNDRSYEIEVSPVSVNNKVSGYILLIFDRSYEEANEMMRKEFAANVSHELKTPLQSISGYAELLQSGMVRPGDEKECVDKIYSESQRMIQLVHDVIKLSHLDNEETVPLKEYIDLSILTKEAVSMMENDFQNGITLQMHTEEDCLIYGNRELLESIIINLVENAIRYNKENGKVFVDVYKDDDKVYLKVRDTGIGIAPSDHERIFERFYRVDKARSKQAGGTGLGLSIVKHSCILNNAEISVESKLDEGSSFTVTFDRADITNNLH